MELPIALGVSLFGALAYGLGVWRGRRVTERLIMLAVMEAIEEVGYSRDETTFILKGDEDGFHVEQK